MDKKRKYKHNLPGIEFQRHGMAGTRVYNAWISMLHRCLNIEYKRYKDYGGRGIKVCDRWKTFVNFYEDMGDPPLKYELDRKDNEGNYNKDNCRWVDNITNSQNARTSKRWVIEDKIYTSLREAAIGSNVSTVTIRSWCKNKDNCFSYLRYS